MEGQKIGYIVKEVKSKKYVLESVLGSLRLVDDINDATIYVKKEIFLNKEIEIGEGYVFLKVDYGIKILEELK